MWDFLFGYFFGRATGIGRILRPVLWLLLVGLVVAAFVYAGVVLNAVNERNLAPHVQPHSTR
jgi:hypothetical protein